MLKLFLFVFGVCSIPVFIAWFLDWIAFNHGKCRHCGSKLKSFDVDSQGGRGYICPKCEHTVWISYPVDD